MRFKRGLLFLFSIGVVACAQEPSQAGATKTAPVQTQPPASMTKMVVRLTGPGIKPNSHAALPRTIYRAGSHFARIEDPPDIRQQIERVTIIAEPDAYSYNLIGRTGTHVIDQGGESDLHLPVVLPFDPKRRLSNLDRLEFGAELDFFEKAGAIKTPGPLINSKPTDAHHLKTTGGEAILVVNSETQSPIKLTWQSSDGTYAYEYSTYADVPFDTTLFSRPAGVKFRDLPPDTPSRE